MSSLIPLPRSEAQALLNDGSPTWRKHALWSEDPSRSRLQVSSPFEEAEYLLRVNQGSGPPEAKTPVHSHPGSEAFYVIAGKLGQQTPSGVSYVEAGHTMNGHTAGMPMQVFNGGTTELTALIMFVVDATKPFSVPAALPVSKTSQSSTGG